jgi:Ca2+-binding EF-hand superfamily protein
LTLPGELEMEGKLESTVAALVAPSAANEKLKELFAEWDVDHTGYIDLKGACTRLASASE